MKIHMPRCFPSQFAVALLCLVFFSLHSQDQAYQYQDARPLKNKLPIERLDESHVHRRQKRDVDPLKNATLDDHKYYTSIYSENNKEDWFELSNHPDRKIENYLSNGFLRSKNFKLQFTFPYYGHPVTNATVTTGGFLYVGYVETSLITSVMYIAPFMAPFDPSLNDSAMIYYFSNATQFTVQWTNLHLSKNKQVGPFTFQCTLYKDGRILFAYKSLPLSPLQVFHNNSLKKHPVRVGISDAFYGYRYLYDQYNRLYRVRIFYVYHKVNKTSQINSKGSTLLLNPIKNCVSAKNCSECIDLKKSSQFKCAWCSTLKRCSDGLDRHRVEWYQKLCQKTAAQEYKKCPSSNGGSNNVNSNYSESKSGISKGATAAIVFVCILLIIVIGLGAWCFYAYTHPVSRSGLFLIELRNKPAQLFKRSDSGATVGGSTTTASKA